MYPSSLAAGGAATVAITPQRQTAVTTVTDTLTWHTDSAARRPRRQRSPRASPTAVARSRRPLSTSARSPFTCSPTTASASCCRTATTRRCTLDPPMIRTPFSIDSPNFPAMLDPNETHRVLGRLSSDAQGRRHRHASHQLAAAPGRPARGHARRRGQAPDDDDAGCRHRVGQVARHELLCVSCSSGTSHPAGGIPIVLALLACLPTAPTRRLPLS